MHIKINANINIMQKPPTNLSTWDIVFDKYLQLSLFLELQRRNTFFHVGEEE